MTRGYSGDRLEEVNSKFSSVTFREVVIAVAMVAGTCALFYSMCWVLVHVSIIIK